MSPKGHDFPNVTLVGAIAADLSLCTGDFRAGERTFQLLTQAAGRAGRGSLPGQMVIQTYQPDHYALVRAARQDYEGFYEEEILYREMLGYPPAAHMLAVQIYAKEEDKGMRLAELLAQSAKKTPVNLQIIGPAAASIGRINDIFRFVFYVKQQNYDKLIQTQDVLEKDIKSVFCLRPGR